jgi:hypothetical protein
MTEAPIAGKRLSRTTLVVTILLVGVLLPIVGRSSASAAVNYTAQGDIIGMNPASSVTENTFVLSCLAGEYPPPSQGIDAWVFQLPEALTKPESTRVTGSGSEIGEYDLDVWFYEDDCAFIDDDNMVTGSFDEVGTAPTGTRYVVVQAFIGMNTHVEIQVGGGTDPSPTATGSPSPTETPTETSQVSTTLAADRRVAGYNQAFLLGGRVSGDEECGDLTNYQVQISKRISGAKGATSLSESVPVRSDGTWSYEHRSSNTATYVASVPSSTTCAAEQPATKEVGVSAKVAVAKPSRCRAPEKLSGTVTPRYPGTKVLLQRRSGGAWKTIDTDKLSSRSRFSLLATRCSGSYRVLWPKQRAANEAGMGFFRL